MYSLYMHPYGPQYNLSILPFSFVTQASCVLKKTLSLAYVFLAKSLRMDILELTYGIELGIYNNRKDELSE